MLRSLYTAGWSMLAQSKSMDVVSNNLANVNTTAFKKDVVVFESFPEVLAKRVNDRFTPSNPTNNVGGMQLGSDVGEVFINFKQGAMQSTANNLDLSIQGNDAAFFTVGVPDENGELKTYYTQDGAFKIDTNGVLTTSEGYPVLSEEDQPIIVGNDRFSVKEDGSIYTDQEFLGQLQIKQFEKPNEVMRKFGKNLLTATPEDAATVDFTGVVRQGFLELSNVNSIREMVDMISIMRAYEANQKVIQSIDGMLEKTVNEVGSVK